jgi:hypothetical protein
MTVSDTIQGPAQIRAERDRLAAEGKQILERSTGSLNDEDAARFTEIERELEDLRKRYDQWDKIERALAAGHTEGGADRGHTVYDRGRTDAARTRTERWQRPKEILTRDESVADWLRQRGDLQRDDEALSFDRYLRGVVTGNWRNADGERDVYQRALSEGHVDRRWTSRPHTAIWPDH